jgi:hypothetical protein
MSRRWRHLPRSSLGTAQSAASDSGFRAHTLNARIAAVWLSEQPDCGLGGRVHEQIALAKLKALVEGAELPTRQLWS